MKKYKKMNKILLSIVLLSVVAMPMIALAAETLPAVADTFNVDSLIVIIDNIADFIFTGLLIAATFFIILAAWNYMNAGGETEKLDSARDQIKNALIGIIIAMVAKGLVLVVKNLIGTNLAT